MPLLLIQKYNYEDSRFIFDLRNKLYVRKASINKEKIDYPVHKIWMINFLKDKKNKLLIIISKRKKIGFIRLEKKNFFFYLSWAMLRKYHKKGIFSKSLKAATNEYKLKYKAVIIKENISSIKSALKAGFIKTKKNGKIFHMSKN
tara:strand:- start:365 stop:799 length:435 start_codon:yes stop_codon:yes gene_type:complete